MFSIQMGKNVRTDKDGYSFLFDIYRQVNLQEVQPIAFDFSLCQFLDANLSSVLGALFDSLTGIGYEIWLRGVRTGVRRTLERNGFLKTMQGDFELSGKDREGFVKYRMFSVSQGDEFKTYINEELINKQQFPKHTILAGKYINTNIYEIFVNAVTHGNCSHVYCSGEFFPDKEPPKLDMTIVNCGDTIERNVNAFLSRRNMPIRESHHSIQWAIKEGNTTKETTGGLGLSMLIDFLNLNNGSMHIVSSDGFYSFSEGKDVLEKLDYPFPGTIVNMEFNFNDDNVYCMTNEKIDLNDLL